MSEEITEQDAEWITQHVDVEDAKDDAGAAFEGTVFMSTDAKHTVSIKANTPEGRKQGMIWMKQVYSRLMEVYGSKQENAAKAYKKAESDPYNRDTSLGSCPKCGGAMKMSQKGKAYCADLCWKK